MEKVRRKKMQVGEKVGKSRTVYFPMICGSAGSKSNLERSQLARWEMRKCTPFWREAHVQVKMYKTHQAQTTFGSWDVEKVHLVVARSSFPSQNVQNIPGSDHFLTLRCRKSARRCGAKHISKSKVSKHDGFGPLFDVFEVDNYNYNYNYATLLYTTQGYTPLHYPTLHYTRPITPLQYDCNYTTLIAVHHNYNSTALRQRLQLQYTTLHPAVVGKVTTATIAATPTNTTPTTFRSISGFALPSVIHNNQPLL